jgi:Flp pilus assembly protein TadG
MLGFFRLLDRLRRDQRGNIAVIFAIALLPLLSFTGAAIDYSRANNARTSMQSSLDSVALMLSKDLTQGLIKASEVQTKAQDYFNALYTNKDAAQSATVTATYTPATTTTAANILVTGSGRIMTDFMTVAGFPTMSFNTSSTATWGTSLLRVALVLDNTGSMQSSGKIDALKTASQNLVDQLSALAKNDGDVYISVVPFEADVNVGTSNVNASWLRWDTWDPQGYFYSGSWPSGSWKSYCSGGTVPANSFWTMAQCLGHGGSWNHTPNTSDKSQWNGCVTDRDQSYDVTATAPSSHATRFVADQELECPVAKILPLSYNWTNVKATINSMTAQGGTNQTIGLQWGWLSLLQQAPLNAPAESTAAGTSYQHIIVLFTDGLNTGDRWYSDFGAPSPQVDARMATLCTNIKNSGVTIFAVQIDTDGAGQSAVLPACASGPGNYFMLTDPSQIAAAFKQIGTSISQLRVAQ